MLVLVCVWCAWLDTYLGYTLESLSNFDFFGLWITCRLVELKAQSGLNCTRTSKELVYVDATGYLYTHTDTDLN